MDAEYLAKEADRLLRDDVLNRALDAIRQATLEDLATANAGDPNMVLRFQQKVAAIDDLRGELKAAILRRPSSPASRMGAVA